jgi:hypothetical protein
MGGTDKETCPLHLPSTYVCEAPAVLGRNHSRIFDRQLISAALLLEDILLYVLKVFSCHLGSLNRVLAASTPWTMWFFSSLCSCGATVIKLNVAVDANKARPKDLLNAVGMADRSLSKTGSVSQRGIQAYLTSAGQRENGWRELSKCPTACSVLARFRSCNPLELVQDGIVRKQRRKPKWQHSVR